MVRRQRDLVQYLVETLEANRLRHSEADLLAHLCGTAKLLRAWGRPEAVCRAGLFHACYGTEAFAPSLVDLAHRKKVRRRIGARAERLVYLFCARVRAKWRLDQVGPRFELHDRYTRKAVVVSKQTWLDLNEIDCANWLEQVGRLLSNNPELQFRSIQRFQAAARFLSPRSFAAVQRRLARLQMQLTMSVD